jgi:hypothetical protein
MLIRLYRLYSCIIFSNFSIEMLKVIYRNHNFTFISDIQLLSQINFCVLPHLMNSATYPDYAAVERKFTRPPHQWAGSLTDIMPTEWHVRTEIYRHLLIKIQSRMSHNSQLIATNYQRSNSMLSTPDNSLHCCNIYSLNELPGNRKLSAKVS